VSADVRDAEGEETMDERHERHVFEKKALVESPADDSLRAVILRLLTVGGYSELFGEGGCCHEDALLAFAAASNKAVAVALLGADRVSSNTFVDLEFGTEDAARVLLGVSALLEAGPQLLSSVRDASREAEKARNASPEVQP